MISKCDLKKCTEAPRVLGKLLTYVRAGYGKRDMGIETSWQRNLGFHFITVSNYFHTFLDEQFDLYLW